MGTIINIIAVLVGILSLLVTLGYAGYLLGFDKAARSRAGGEAVRADLRKRLVPALIATAMALLGLLLTNGGLVADLIGACLAVGAASYAMSLFRTTRQHYR